MISLQVGHVEATANQKLLGECGIRIGVAWKKSHIFIRGVVFIGQLRRLFDIVLKAISNRVRNIWDWIPVLSLIKSLLNDLISQVYLFFFLRSGIIIVSV